MPTTAFFRIMTEGPTIDGRDVSREWIEEMAATYDPATYTARVNCEHIAGYSPERPFNSYGSVKALKTEEFSIAIGGKEEKRLALLAQIDANEQLVEINKAGQKFFASAEVKPNFADSGKAYLVGLAVTDRPAVLGLEPLKFASLGRDNLFTPALEEEIAFLPETPAEDPEKAARAGLFAALAALFKTGEAQKTEDSEPPAEPAPRPAPPVGGPANDNAALAAFAAALPALLSAEVEAAVAPLKTEIASLKTQLDAPVPFSRPLATGTSSALTDC